MDEITLGMYWNDIPVGKENAVDYSALCDLWGKDRRTVRRILHELSGFDDGDNYVLIRSGKSRGFYKTDNFLEIESYKKECLNKGRSVFAPVKKCNRILNAYDGQYNMFNNLRTIRESKKMTQAEVCKKLYENGSPVDVPLLSKMENNVILPTTHDLMILSRIYAVEPSDLIKWEIPTELLNGAI